MDELMIIRKWNYSKNPKENGWNGRTVAISVGAVTFFFSYDTVVAYKTPEEGLVITENNWQATTGKHLNWIHPDHDLRIPHSEFNLKLGALLSRMNLGVVGYGMGPR